MKPIRLIIFAKAPLPGLAKTRLIPALGEVGAAALARTMLHHTVAQALSSQVGSVELCATPASNNPEWAGLDDPAWPLIRTDQGEGDLGERLARASKRALEAGQAVLLIGTDCPALDPTRLIAAAAALADADSVMIPGVDGGYVLLGLNQFHPEIFHNIRWSTAEVAAATQAAITKLGWSLQLFPSLADIDEPADLIHIPPTWHFQD